MITAVDTNILIDVLEPDPEFGPSSREALRACLLEGQVVACGVVWAEVATAYGDKTEKLLEALASMGIIYSPMTQDAAQQAARCWAAYRESGGRRDRIAADFLVGGHAVQQADRLLTRDSGFFRGYFGPLEVMTTGA